MAGRRRAALEKQGLKPRDLIFYYVGHGSFSNPDQQYILAIRATRKNYEGVSSVKMIDLGSTLSEAALDLRRYLILDCCFAAAAVKSLMGPVNDVVHRKTLEAFPPNGTTLLCASDAHDSAQAPPDLPRTIFSDTMLSILSKGDRTIETGLSMNALGSLIRNGIREKYKDYAGLPEVHTPVQTEGNIAAIPLFPNAANRPRHLKEQIEAVVSQLSQTQSALESSTARLAVVEKTLLSRIETLEKDNRFIAEFQSRLEVLENRPVHVDNETQSKDPWQKEKDALDAAPPYVLENLHHYYKALRAGRIWLIASLAVVTLSVFCLGTGYSLFHIYYIYDPVHWVPPAVFTFTSITAFWHLRTRRILASVESAHEVRPWERLPEVIAAKNANYVKLLSSLIVVSPYFEFACFLYLIQIIIFFLRVIGHAFVK